MDSGKGGTEGNSVRLGEPASLRAERVGKVGHLSEGGGKGGIEGNEGPVKARQGSFN